jgi:hypothetical protein
MLKLFNNKWYTILYIILLLYIVNKIYNINLKYNHEINNENKFKKKLFNNNLLPDIYTLLIYYLGLI